MTPRSPKKPGTVVRKAKGETAEVVRWAFMWEGPAGMFASPLYKSRADAVKFRRRLTCPGFGIAPIVRVSLPAPRGAK